MSRSFQPSLPLSPLYTDVRDLYSFEREATLMGYGRIAGVDEAGRGPLAGPVVAAAVILAGPVDGLADSKTLTAARREKLFDAVMASKSSVGVGMTDAADIDRINILQATYEAMRQALDGLSPTPDYILADAVTIPRIAIPQKGIIKGDALSASIAAASIIAKVTRDRLLLELHEKYPQYGFDIHKGYGTALHLARLREHGPCPAHRVSFRGVLQPESDAG